LLHGNLLELLHGNLLKATWNRETEKIKQF
jgi:hypothetical protein